MHAAWKVAAALWPAELWVDMFYEPVAMQIGSSNCKGLQARRQHLLPLLRHMLCCPFTGPFINNCVGRGNLRPFLLFLLWTILAAAYVLAMCSVLVWREWDVGRESAVIHNSLSQGSISAPSNSSSSSTGGTQLSSSLSSPEYAVGVLASPAALSSSSSSGNSSMQPTAAGQQAVDAGWSSARLVASGGMLLLLLQLAPGWLLATYYLAAASAALLFAVGALLVSQLNYLGSGVTYIQHLKRSAGSAAANGSDHAAAAACADSCIDYWHQAPGDGGPCNGLQQVEIKQHDGMGLAAAAGPVDASVQKQPQHHQALQQHFGKWQLLWVRVNEVLGVDSGSGSSLSRALLVPRWQPVLSGAATPALKKWS
jgi:hypothetical protein